MLFGRPDSPDPYTPIPAHTARARRASQSNPSIQTSTTLLSPGTAARKYGRNTRARAASMPSNSRPAIKITIPDPTRPTPTSNPTKPSVSPSRLPRYQAQSQFPRYVHQQSTSLNIPKSSIPRPIRTSSSSSELPIPSPKSQCPGGATPSPRPRRFIKQEPLIVIQHLRNLLAQDGLEWSEYLQIDDLIALHEREIMEGAHRPKHHQNKLAEDDTLSVFGTPLRQTSLFASTKAIFGGYEHDLPILVFSCVEELHRQGISTTSSFPNLSARSHHLEQLVRAFNCASTRFGLDAALSNQRLEDVYCLLATYLAQLPEPVFAPSEIARGLENALLVWCIEPQSGTRILNPIRIKIAQLLLRLLPSPHLSLFVYLMAFLSQIASKAEDEETRIETLGRTFGRWMFGGGGGGGGESRATTMMMWFLLNWSAVINGFFDDLPALSSSAWKSRRSSIVDPQATPRISQDSQTMASTPRTLFDMTSSSGLTGLAGDGSEGPVTPSSSAFRVGMIPTQSYGYLTANSTESSRAASIVDVQGCSPTAPYPAAMSIVGKAQQQQPSKDDDDMSRCSSGSACKLRVLSIFVIGRYN
ncbi:hypothetical protein PM082_023291 [Marasmius tenuissimus]|nr:hypothetical protein PM082_023291 [Marasmius tenuissimus]